MFFFAFAVALFWSTTVSSAQEQAPAPAYKEGDSWQFKVLEKSNESSTRP
jgi:hypothetical protein